MIENISSHNRELCKKSRYQSSLPKTATVLYSAIRTLFLHSNMPFVWKLFVNNFTTKVALVSYQQQIVLISTDDVIADKN